MAGQHAAVLILKEAEEMMKSSSISLL